MVVAIEVDEMVALETTSIHLKARDGERDRIGIDWSALEMKRLCLPIKCILAFSAEEVDMVLELKFEDKVFIHTITF